MKKTVEKDNLKTCLDVVYLLKCVVENVKPDIDRIGIMNLDDIYDFARMHMITSMVGAAVASAGINDNRFSYAVAFSFRRMLRYEKEYNAVISGLEELNINYLPLKGIVIKKLYPEPWMREMCDHDILIEKMRAHDVRRMMEDLGYTTVQFGKSKDDKYIKAQEILFEMHTSLLEYSKKKEWKNYYEINDKQIKDGNNHYGYHFSDEDFYVYMIVHTYHHFYYRGTGIRSLLDIFIYLKKTDVDMEYIRRELNKLGIIEFEEKCRDLANKLFRDVPLNKSELGFFRFFYDSAVYGSIQNKIRLTGGHKVLFMWKRFLVPFSKKNNEYELFANLYPGFYKHKILLPLLPFYRIIRSIKEGRFYREFKEIINTSK